MSLEPPPVTTPFNGARIETTPLAKWLYLLWRYLQTAGGVPGPTGPTGATGPQGPTGPAGPGSSVPAHVAAITQSEIAYWNQAYVDSQAIPGTEVLREAQFTPMVLAGVANTPSVGDLVDANMKCYHFAGAGPLEELSFSWDLQHDYKSGSDVVFHVHWAPATAAAGDVYFKAYYLWESAGAVIPAPTLLAIAAVPAPGVAWHSTRTDFTIPGVGRTFNARLVVRLIRDPGDAEDTYADDAALVSVGIHYTAIPLQP